MERHELPERASLEWLKKRAKERLARLRETDASATLADAQLAIAREHGFASWRAMKAEIDRRRAGRTEAFFAAVRARDLAAIRALLDHDPSLVHARDEGDHATALHFATSLGVDVVRLLLDAGADVHGVGDLHELEVIGWATVFGPTIDQEVVDLLVERGARHHIFSAIAMKDPTPIRRVVETVPDALARRLSKFEGRQSALHYVIAPPDALIGGGFRTGDHYAMLELLIALGADLEAEDARGRTPLALAMLRGDADAMRILTAAGARAPVPDRAPDDAPSLASLRSSVTKVEVMLAVPDVRATIEWYRAIGFELAGAHGDGDVLDWAAVSFGGAYLMFVPGGERARGRTVSLWLRTTRIDEIYRALKRIQLEHARARLAGEPPAQTEVRFTQDIHDAFYGQREFTVVDLNGYELSFAQDS